MFRRIDAARHSVPILSGHCHLIAIADADEATAVAAAAAAGATSSAAFHIGFGCHSCCAGCRITRSPGKRQTYLYCARICEHDIHFSIFLECDCLISL